MSNLFTQLQQTKQDQQAQARHLESVEDSPIHPDQNAAKIEQNSPTTQAVTHLSKGLSKPLSKSMSKTPTTDAVETLAFQLRKIPKVRVNADIPAEWKQQLDDLAYKLKVGKYDLMLYLIAQFLGKSEQEA